jgi:hypothetical protein
MRDTGIKLSGNKRELAQMAFENLDDVLHSSIIAHPRLPLLIPSPSFFLLET